MSKETLWLPIQRKWFDRIESGEKTEEYRELSDYWKARIDLQDRPRIISLRNGYGKDRPTLHRKCYGIRIGKGNPEWGAPTDREVFIIKLGPPCWSEERRKRVRASRRRNRRLREIGEIQAKNPLLWQWEALRQGYQQEEIDSWDGQRKKRKKKPISKWNKLPPLALVEMDYTSRKITVKEQIQTRSIPQHWWEAQYIRFEARNRSSMILERMDTGMIQDDEHLRRLLKTFISRHPHRSGWVIVAAFERITGTDKVLDHLRQKVTPLKKVSDYAE